MSQLKITLKRSPIGHSETQKRTVRALGLRRLHQTVYQPDNPSIRGMIARIPHLLHVEVVQQPAADQSVGEAPTHLSEDVAPAKPRRTRTSKAQKEVSS